jgi:hypothetical protein
MLVLEEGGTIGGHAALGRVLILHGAASRHFTGPRNEAAICHDRDVKRQKHGRE